MVNVLIRYMYTNIKCVLNLIIQSASEYMMFWFYDAAYNSPKYLCWTFGHDTVYIC